jgi:ubiquinone/menaquinone biosynthesis C-methylase UbiE
MSEHEQRIVEQFSQQAIPFSTAPAIRDEAALSRLVQASGAGAEDTVLDVACGPGLVVGAFASVAARVTGIDLTPAMIERAREHTRNRTNVELSCGDVERLPFEAASFSIVVSRFAFHHFLHPERVLSEMKRVCKPGGRVLVCDLIADPDPAKAEAFHALELQRDPSHARSLPLPELEALFDAAELPRRPTLHTTLKFDIDGLVERSFPSEISREQLKRLYLDTLDNDGLGLGLRRNQHGVVGRYNVVLIVTDRV